MKHPVEPDGPGFLRNVMTKSGGTLLNHTTGILLAGAHPWSNSAFDSLMARSLLPVAHRPVISYGLLWLHRQGINEVAVCGTRETRLLQSRLARHVPDGMTVSYRQDQLPRGAAGSARDAAMATDADTFVVADGTCIPNIDLSALLLKHHSSGACVTVVVHSNARPSGDAALRAPSGIYVFARRAFARVSAHGFCDIKEEVIPQLYAAGERIVAFEASDATPRVLDASTYMAMNEWMVEQVVRGGEGQDGYQPWGSALVHRDATIDNDARMVGPVLVGPCAVVKSGAVIVGPASIGREAIIESGAFVSRSAVWRRSSIGEHAIADQCIVADDAIVASGAHTSQSVVLAGRSEMDWVAQQLERAATAPTAVVGVKHRRLVFGSSWLRTPAA
jgi:NDP-sugar pyrophosphorylase family protein